MKFGMKFNKKIIFIFVLSLLFSVFAFSQNWEFSVKGNLFPSWNTGGSYIAQNDYLTSYASGVSSVSDGSYKQSTFGGGIQLSAGYFVFSFLAFDLDFAIRFNSGLTTKFSKTSYTYMKYYRNFTSYEIYPLVKLLPVKTNIFALSLFLGPVFEFTGSTTKEGYSSDTENVERLQSLFIFASILGTEMNLFLSQNFAFSFEIAFKYDFKKTFDSSATSEWFFTVAGTSFSLPISLGFSFFL